MEFTLEVLGNIQFFVSKIYYIEYHTCLGFHIYIDADLRPHVVILNPKF